MIRTLTGWEPHDDEAVRCSRRWAPGEIAQPDFTKPREQTSLSRYWVLVRIVYENSEQFKSKEQVHDFLKRRAGYVTEIVSKSTGEVYEVANSISFDTLDEAEFLEVWRKVVDVVCKDILPGIDENMLEYEILKLCGLAGGGK